jgi:uncharacterized membrane protein
MANDQTGQHSHHQPHDGFGIPSVAVIGHHPIHPMLVPVPIGLFVGALLADLAYWASSNSGLATAAAWLIAAGILGGVIAAAAGLPDFIGRPEIRALYHSYYHLIGNVIMLAVAAVNLALRISAGAAEVVLPWGLLMSVAVVVLLAFTGWHGGEMVFGHGVGMARHEHGSH